MSEQLLEVSISDGVGVVALNRPEKFNCLSVSVYEALDAAITRFENDHAVRVMVIRANGKHFCTGADLEEVKSILSDKEKLGRFIRFGHEVLKRLEASDLPVLGVIQGYCLAGGIELALACDVLFAASSAKIGDQHATFGLVPGWGGSQRLPRQIGQQRALELMFSGRHLTAAEAQSWGLVSHVYDADVLLDKAMAYAQDLVKKSRPGLAAMKRLARDGMQMTANDALRMEAEFMIEALQSADVSEGISAFQEKRTPVFKT